MSEQEISEKSCTESRQPMTPETTARGTVTNPEGANANPDVEAAKKLTAEEQMALYEKALKEDDWGHQPC